MTLFENNLRNSYIVPREKEQRISIHSASKKYKVPRVSVVVIHEGKIAWVKTLWI